MSQFWSPFVHSLTPYIPGEQPLLSNLVKLNTNENPYGPSPRALEAMRQTIGQSLRLYPDPNASALKAAVADYYQLTPQQVFVGNGSDEVLAFAFMGFFKQAHPILFPDITYSFYPVYCGLYGIDYCTVPLDPQFTIRPQDYCQPNGGIIFPNPNAPTGRLLASPAIEELLNRHRDSVVVVDEAYIDFGGQSAAPLVARHPNLLIIQTLSKSRSLAGLRVGLALGHPDLVDALECIKNSFNSYPLDRIAQAGAIEAFNDKDWFEHTRTRVIASREQLVASLEELGFETIPSAANFVLTCHPQHDAVELSAALRARSIIVRHFKNDRIDQFLRITVGTDEQCRTLVEALKEITR